MKEPQQAVLFELTEVEEAHLPLLLEQHIKDVEYLVGELAVTYTKLTEEIIANRKEIVSTKNVRALIPLNALINRLLIASSSNLQEINHTWQLLIDWSAKSVNEEKANDTPV